MQYPIDAIDGGSQVHDAFYWKVGASGWQSAITDLRTWTSLVFGL